MKDSQTTPETPDTASAQDLKKQPSWVKLALEFGPLIIFFLSFKFGDIFIATGIFMVTMIISILITKKLHGHVSLIQKLTFVVVMIMGGLTIYLQDETFTKMKLTIINGIFASILLIGLLRGRLYLKMVMEMAFEMDDAGWKTFTKRYVGFLIVMAVINEVIWRTQSTDFWVNFKTFGYMGLTFIFMFAQMPLFMKYINEEDKDEQASD